MKNNDQDRKARRVTVAMIRLIADSLRDAIIMMDPHGYISYWNKSAERIFGYTKEEAIGKMLHELIVSTDAAAAHQRAFPLFQQTGVGTVIGKTIEREALRKDGKKIKIQLSLSSLEIEGQWHAVGIVRDDTERSRHLEMLQLQADVLESAIDGIASLDIDQKYEFLNSAHEQIYGYEKGELIGKSWRILYNPEELERFETEIFPMLMKTGVFQGEAIGMKKDGSLFPQELSLKMLPGGRMTCIVRDMTERKKDEEERRELEKCLNHSLKMEAVGSLASGIAHDLNNRLSVIMGCAEMTQVDITQESYASIRGRIGIIIDEVRRGARVISDLLKFARQKSQDAKTIDVSKLIKNTLNLFATTEKAISILEKYAPDLWPVDVDPGCIEDVIMNLLVNAGHAVKGSGRISLETENVVVTEEEANRLGVNPGRYVKIVVEDNGTGIAEKDKRRIFDPFFTTKDVGKGTGLGLAMVYGVIQQYKGSVDVESQLGQGTRFLILLPASDKEIVEEKKNIGGYMPGSQERILLIDDEPMPLSLANAVLSFLGYQVHPCSSVKESIGKLQEDPNAFDLVITDMTMPGMSGGDALAEFRKINPGLKVLLMSGYDFHSEVGKNGWFDGFIKKPFEIEPLSIKIREVLEK